MNDFLTIAVIDNDRGGHDDSLDPGNYYCETTDFESESEKFVTVEKPIFISMIEKQIEKLRGGERRL
jgi:hypothetical protein